MSVSEKDPKSLAHLNPYEPHLFEVPKKCINDGNDVSFWLSSIAYADIMTFLLQLNVCMFPVKTDEGTTSWPLTTVDVPQSTAVSQLRKLLDKLEAMIDEAPPDTGPRRFGNVSFRKWYNLVTERCPALLREHLSSAVAEFPHEEGDGCTAMEELQCYLLGSFGSSQRLDYGTGHELSFLAFLACIWKLGGFEPSAPGTEERGIVLGLIEPYLNLVRRLIMTYNLEPAGSHGVWGLDDHSFLPYIFGSAQLSPPITSFDSIPLEGSAPDAPKSSDVAKKLRVDRERHNNMYFSAIGFIYDVKKGPFWEHSPILFDVSGVTAGWAKINKGMLKMYNAEVLSKFPVVQHFPFGSLFRWERDPTAAPPPQQTAHIQHQPRSGAPPSATSISPSQTARPPPGPGTQAPWASAQNRPNLPVHTIPHPAPGRQPGVRAGPLGMPPMQAPWASSSPASAARPSPPSFSQLQTPTAVGGIKATETAAGDASAKPGSGGDSGAAEGVVQSANGGLQERCMQSNNDGRT